jgi:hypothetical protein
MRFMYCMGEWIGDYPEERENVAFSLEQSMNWFHRAWHM